MRLSNVDIEFFRRTGQLDITPYDDDCLQGASYDLHLACYVREPYWIYQEDRGDELVFDEVGWTEPQKFEEDCRGNLYYVLKPNAFVLLSTVEKVWISPSLGSAVAGKSSRAREGIAVEFAGWVDPGFGGTLTLEVKNNLPFPIKLTAGMRICQVTFELLRTPSTRPYGERGHYQGQNGPTTSWESK